MTGTTSWVAWRAKYARGAAVFKPCPVAWQPQFRALHHDAMAELSAEDRVAIGELLASYCYAIDLGRWETLPQLFTDDCRLDFGATMGVHEGREGLRAFTDSLRSASIRMRHYLTNVVIAGDGERARAESYVLAFVGEPGALHQTTGRYEDELVKRGGRWAIRLRRAVIELPPT